jgi:hypothetical protein
MDKLARLGWAAAVGVLAWTSPGAWARPGPEAVALYNAACAESLAGESDKAAASLLKAVKAGFHDFSHMRRDPDLRELRTHPVYRAIVDARAAADDLLTERNLQRWRERLDPGRYRFETDDEARTTWVTALDETARRDARRMLDELSAALAQSLFGPPTAGAPDHGRVIIVLPAAEDAARVLGEPNAAGVYRHGRRELIAFDAGRSLRHEFVHALHQAHMDRVGQEHAAWVQEGLATLYEDYRSGPAGDLVFTPNDRQPLTRDLAQHDRLIRWQTLMAMDASTLRAEARRAYPELRSIFRYLAEQGRLETWYERYVDGFAADPSGVAALEAALGRPLDDLEQRWRRWLAAQPAAEPEG